MSNFLLLFLNISSFGWFLLLIELFSKEFNFAFNSLSFLCFFFYNLFLYLNLLYSWSTLCFLFVKELFISLDFFSFKFNIKLLNLLLNQLFNYSYAFFFWDLFLNIRMIFILISLFSLLNSLFTLFSLFLKEFLLFSLFSSNQFFF